MEIGFFLIRINKEVPQQLAFFIPDVTVFIINVKGLVLLIRCGDQQRIDVQKRDLPYPFFVSGIQMPDVGEIRWLLYHVP
jgi:hypothetical protein